jgi:hypothetical protein
MPEFTISFTAPDFSVSFEPQITLGLVTTIPSLGISFEGVDRMAFTTNVGAGNFRTRLRLRGKAPANNELAVPPDFPVPVWTGFNDAIATHVVAPDNMSVEYTPVSAGTFTVQCSVTGLMPVTEDYTINVEPVDHLELTTENV